MEIPVSRTRSGFSPVVDSGIIPWLSLNKVGQWSLLKKVDDTFGVLHTHAVAGLVGGLMVGLVANPAMVEYLTSDPKGSVVNFTGLFYGNPKQLLIQAEAAAVIIIWNIIGTFIVLKVISFIVPLRASDGEVEGGDLAIHGIDPMPVAFPAPPTAKEPAGV